MSRHVQINPITGDKIKTKVQNDKYAEGWERIYGERNKKGTVPELREDGKGQEGGQPSSLQRRG